MRRSSIFKAVLAASVAFCAAVPLASAQEGDFTYRWHLFGSSGDTENPGGPGTPGGPGNPENPGPVENGVVITDPEELPGSHEPGPDNFDMVATTNGAGSNFSYQCFEVAGGSGHYSIFAGPMMPYPPEWVSGFDVVALAQLNSSFAATQLEGFETPAPPNTTPMTEFCVRVGKVEASGNVDPLTMAVGAGSFPAATYSDYNESTGGKALTFTMTPEVGQPSDSMPPVLVGENALGAGYSDLAPDIAFFETQSNAATPLSVTVTEWSPHHFNDGISPDSGYCFNVSGGYGNFIYAFAIDVQQNVTGDTPQWVVSDSDMDVSPSGQVSLAPGMSTTTVRSVCVDFFKGGDVEDLDSTFLLQVVDFPTAGSKPGFAGRSSMVTATWRNWIDLQTPDGPPLGPPM